MRRPVTPDLPAYLLLGLDLDVSPSICAHVFQVLQQSFLFSLPSLEKKKNTPAK